MPDNCEYPEAEVRGTSQCIHCGQKAAALYTTPCPGPSPDLPTFELALTTPMLLHEIAMPEMTQRDIASMYGLALRSSWETDWAKVNAAIVERWSRSGLERIKEAARAGKWKGVPFGEGL